MGIPAPSESGAQAAVRDWLRVHGAFPVRVNSGGMKVGKRFVRFNAEPGCSDLLVCWPVDAPDSPPGGDAVLGLFLAVEVKKPGGRTEVVRRAEQESFAGRVRKAGGVALTVTGAADLEAQLKARGLY